jgi:hypothetical protein
MEALGATIRDSGRESMPGLGDVLQGWSNRIATEPLFDDARITVDSLALATVGLTPRTSVSLDAPPAEELLTPAAEFLGRFDLAFVFSPECLRLTTASSLAQSGSSLRPTGVPRCYRREESAVTPDACGGAGTMTLSSWLAGASLPVLTWALDQASGDTLPRKEWNRLNVADLAAGDAVSIVRGDRALAQSVAVFLISLAAAATFARTTRTCLVSLIASATIALFVPVAWSAWAAPVFLASAANTGRVVMRIRPSRGPRNPSPRVDQENT